MTPDELDKLSESATPERYGRVKIATIRKTVDELRAAIQAEGTPRIQEKWDRAEQWVDRIFQPTDFPDNMHGDA